MPEYMIPGAFVHLESLPLTINGKLDRKQLPEADFTGDREYTAPETELQEKLCQAYGEVLGLDSNSIGIYDDFFRLGGNSIMAIKLISKIRQHLDLSIQVAAVFSHKTVASLASVLEGESKDSYALIAPIEVSSPEEQRLSFAQERLWFIEAYEGGSDVYNIPMSFRLDQKIQLELLQKSMEIVIMRHEVLRSVIRTTESGMGYQFVTDLIPEFNLTEVETEEELKEQINEYACKVFHLGTELPIEVNILRLGEQSYLSVVIHHIAFDGWSVNIFLREIQTVYEALVNGKDYQLPEIKFQYKDFALWQRNYLTGEILEKQIHYWKNELEDFESLNMPLDFNRPAYISYEGATAHFNLSAEVASGLRKLSKDFGVSLYSVMLGGYYLMLSAYSGQDDIVVGSPIANRHHAELEDLIGFFVNTLALRKKIDSEQTIKDFILEISSSVIEAQSHQDLPFEKLVDELGVEQDTSRHPVFQVMFGLQSFERDSSHDESAIFYPFNEEIEYHTAKFDLTTMIDDSEETIRGMFNYATSLFKRETIMRIKDTYLMLLKQLSYMSNEGAEHIKINDLQLLEETNYRQVTEEWNATDSTYPFDKTIHQLFEEQVVKTPDHIALVYQDVRLSYTELNEKANRLANHLIQTYGLQPDDLVPLCLKRSENMLIAILGVMKAGAAYVPMDPSYPEDRIEHILRDTEATIILAQNSTIGKIEVSENTKVISLDEVTFKAMLETADPNNPVTGVRPNNLAYVIYTSGTTGLPKGVMIEHKGVSNLIEQQTREFDLDRKPHLPFSPKNCLWYANYVFDAHVCELYPVITHGHSIYLLDKERQTDIAALQQYITDNQISLASIPPALLTKDFILSVEKLIVAGDVTNPQVMAFYQAAGVDIINGYGPTEGTVCTSLHHYNEDGNPLNIGGPIGNMKAYVVDRYHRIVPIGAVGELYIGGAGIARGYLNRAELTSERFILNPFQSESEQLSGENGRLYKTGDLVRWLPNGELEYIGRNDFQVKIRGFRIELGEIENQLLQYPKIRQTAVLAKDSKTGMKYLVGYYVSDTAIDSETLSAHLSSSLPDYMVPSAYVHLENLPLTINGKLDKKRLPEPEFTGSKDYTAPETPLQVQLCQIYGEVLGLDPGIISIHDDFFRLGGDSIISIQLVSRIRQQQEVRLSVKEIFTARTVSGLSHLITDKKSGSGDTIQSEQGLLLGEVPLLPIQEWYFSQKTEGYLPAFNHWNQSFLIHVPELDPSLLEKSVHHLLEKHDAFRIHYPQENGTYSQQYGGGSLPVIKTLDITGMTAEELNSHLTKWQSDFDIETGPLFQIGYLSGYEDKSARIYFALHHLIIDGVSWRIITDDLKTLYQTLEKGTPIDPPVKGSSYRQWVNAIKTYQSETPALKDQELSYWNNIIETVKESTHSLSRLITDGHHQGYVLLDKTYTGKLIRGSHHAYHTQINDLLLAALSCALTGLTGEKSNAILLESHGREDVFSHLDITETVGWFTSMYPLLLKTGTDVTDTIIHTKESLRSIPNNGIGYGSLIGYTKAGLPKISFNYLGQLDQEDTSGDKTWFIAAEGSGISNSPENRDSHMISINGATIDGQLRFGISGYLSSEHISKFSSDFKTHLETLIDHLSQETRSYLTPSDVGHIVDHTQLAKIQEHSETEGVYLANSLQEGFIYHALNQGEKDDAYRVQLIWDYYAEIEPSKLKTSWKLAQQNYPSLRLRFDWNGEIVQVIDKTGEVDWRYQDISAMSESAQHSHIQELTRKDRFEIYDLSQGRLFRVYLFKRSENHYSCLFSNHHAILDGWSLPVLLNSIHDAYQALLKNQEPIFTPDSAYGDTQKYLQGHKEQGNTFWHNYMSLLEDQEDLSSLVKESQRHIDLGTYRHIQDHQQVKMQIEGDQYQTLKTLTKEKGLTVNAVLQYLWHKQLSIYSGLGTTVVGTTVSGRSLPVDGIESSVGLYINTLPLIVNHGEGRVLDHILEIQERISELNTYSDVNLGSLHHDGRRIFSSLFVYENYPVPKGEGENTLSFEFKAAVEKLDYPLGVMAAEQEGIVALEIKYEGILFERHTIEGLIEGMEILLGQILEDWQIDSKELSFVSDSQMSLMQKLNDATETAYPVNKTIHELFETQVLKTPDDIAVVYQDTKLSYKALNESANRLAHYLVENHGLQPDDLVPLCLERSENMLIAILAVMKSGAAYVPMDPSYPAERIEYILQDTGAKIILAESSTSEKIQPAENTEVICLDDMAFNAMLEASDLDNPVTTVKAENLAYVIYTSGTTGLPKGVMIEHKGVVNLIGSMIQAHRLEDYQQVGCYSNYVFDAFVYESLPVLCNGNTLWLYSNDLRTSVSDLNLYIKENGIEVSFIPPVLLKEIVDNKTSLKLIFAGGESFPALDQNIENITLINEYGPTEGTVCATLHHYKEDHNPLNIGSPINNTTSYVLDDHLRILPVGAVGELYIGGAGIARGYLKQPELTEERFIQNPFQTTEQKEKGVNGRLYKTGDLVRSLSDGELEYMGRNDFQVKIRGYRIELGEIENRLLQYPGVKQAVVLAKESKTGMKYLVGYYISETESEASELSEFLSEILPEYMVPNIFVHLAELPMTINGKIDRRQLPEPEFTGGTEYTAPENEWQEKLCRMYGDVLGLNPEHISIHDNFFRLGGNSIMAIKLISKIKRELGIQVSVGMMFEHKTVASLSHILREESFDEEIIITPVKISSPEEQRLSFAQERLWFIESYKEGSSAYNIPMTVLLGEKTELSVLYKAFKAVIMRHEILRTLIKTNEDGVGYQVVTDFVPEFTITEVMNAEELDAHISQCANKIFRLDSEIPIDINMFRFDNRHYLSVVIHHIAFDGWSAEVFLKELGSLYRTLLSGEVSELSELKIQYKDFALWQRNYLSGKRLDHQIEYWKEKFDDYQTLDLPVDFHRPAEISYEGGMISFNVSEKIADGLREISKNLDVSLYSVMLGGYYLMLSSYSGQDDIVVGSPIANRHYAGLEDLIGFFVNTLALREKIDFEQSLQDFILQVSKSVTEAQSHQDLPFEKLVEELNVVQDTSRHPIFQVMFGIQSFGGEKAPVQDEEAIFYPFKGEIDYQVAKFDLTTMVNDDGKNISGMFNYAKAVFSEETTIRMMNTYIFVLEQMVEIKGKNDLNAVKTSELQMVSGEDLKQMTEVWNDTARAYPKDKTIHELFENQVQKTPDAIAVVYQEKTLSYRDLNEKANRLAHYLLEEYHLKPNDQIPLCMEHSESLLIAVIAVLKAGASYVPIDPSFPSERLRYILENTASEIVLAHENTAEMLKDIGSVNVLSIDDPLFTSLLEDKASSDPVIEVTAQNLAYVIYTSGTTGLPKGVMIHHSALLNYISWAADQYVGNEKTAFSLYSSISFDLTVTSIFTPLVTGNSVIVYKEDDPVTLIEKILEDNQSDIIKLTPSHLRIIRDIDWRQGQKSRLKKMIVGGEELDYQLAKDICDKFDGEITIYNEYGPTEATVGCMIYQFDPLRTAHSVSLGQPINNTQIYVLDKSMNPVPYGAIGEMYISGNSVAKGYFKRDDLTLDRFLQNPFLSGERMYKTGDLARLLSDGNLEYIGRNDFQVKIRGYRIELGEIENSLLQYPGIRQVAVLANENNMGMKYLVGYYVSDLMIEPALISEFLLESLPDYMVPNVFVHLEKLPLTINGKLDRRKLPEPDFTGISEYTAPENELQEKLAQIYGDVLGLDSGMISIHEDFFKLGGNSIMAVKLVSQIKHQLDIPVRIVDVFKEKTISRLSAMMLNHQKEYQAIVAFDQEKNRQKMFLVHPGNGGCEVYRSLAEQLKSDYDCYGIDSYNLYNPEKIDHLNKLADYYLTHMDKIQNPNGGEEYILLGWSFGGTIALEIASLLERRGHRKIKVYLLDTILYAPDQKLTDFLAFPTDEELIEKLGNPADRQRIEEARNFMAAEFAIVQQEVSEKLKYSEVILLKAMLKGASNEDFYEYLFSLPDNNVQSAVENQSLLAVYPVEATHETMLEKQQQIIDIINKTSIK
ncbi:MAG: amino acid adenylation domain-containing protein [Chryseobacterium sp.]|nr:amino acid adenylation domain-containing protein [Chryseobacterium sp.]